MKTVTLIVFVCAVALNVMATGWDQRVDFYCGKTVDFRLYTISENDGVFTVTKWDADKIGKTKPTIAQLKADDVAVDQWVAARAANNSATLVVTPAVQVLLDEVNELRGKLGLPKRTDAEFVSMVTNKAKAKP
ncbi:MAG: hypothetical protein WC822_01540 [Candidatus Paceibacterota bacterium]|jgi:hypothetical protein